MTEETTDQSVLNRIQQLVAQEHRLQSLDALSEEDQQRLKRLRIELDQCWDLLRQRRALRTAGQDPDKAQVRSPDVVENYEE
jgi:hypothetical protein